MILENSGEFQEILKKFSKNILENFENYFGNFRELSCFERFRKLSRKTSENFREIFREASRNMTEIFENYFEIFQTNFRKILRIITENFENFS